MKKSGFWRSNFPENKQLEYLSFMPAPLQDIEINIDNNLKLMLETAQNELKELNMRLDIFKNLDMFLYSSGLKEAVISSQIEGTQSTLIDVISDNKEKNMDIHEVFNYLDALKYTIENPQNMPLCNRFIKSVHDILMTGTRGGEPNKTPGEFRTSQNWIGGSNPQNAKYIPPNPTDMTSAMNDLENYINSENPPTNKLLMVGLVHYQFETIHPFLDGNGRLGRLLIVKLLCEWGLLTKPAIFISLNLKRQRSEYYDRLTAVRDQDDFNGWLIFFLKAVISACQDTKNTAYAIEKLTDKHMEKINNIPRNKNIKRLFEFIQKKPIFNLTEASKELDINYLTAAKACNHLVTLDILQQDNKKRNKSFSYGGYINIMIKDTEACPP